MPYKTRPSPLRLVAASVALCCGLLALPSQAEKADRDQPMHIEADSMRHDETRQLTQFTGKVLATKGSLTLRAETMDVQQDKQGGQLATLLAAPSQRVFFRQKREATNDFTEGEAEQVIYDNQADTITLTRRAEVRILRGTELSDQLHGHTIVFNNITEVVTVDGKAKSSTGTSPGGNSQSEQRVRATLTPRTPAKPAPANAAPAAPALRTSPQLVPRPAS
ncbi:lipopolysaccharide transport periplasmic protein LptA [Limnohabitans sp.]|jgi:lipopolysaccharide export system protein LptA|uniref:lipopolysaccharide transport periplasmic protein LptA n=1 Tax=Limnohabitans sp. TaxID=1907725 RepID=UPI0037BEC304